MLQKFFHLKRMKLEQRTTDVTKERKVKELLSEMASNPLSLPLLFTFQLAF